MAKLYFLLTVAQHRLSQRVSRQCEEHLGVTVTQLGALFVLQKHPSFRKSDLAEKLSCTKAAVTAMAERLATSGFICPTPCEQDKRVTRLSLTSQGNQLVLKSRPLVVQMQNELTKGFTKTELQTITKFLNQIIENNA